MKKFKPITLWLSRSCDGFDVHAERPHLEDGDYWQSDGAVYLCDSGIRILESILGVKPPRVGQCINIVVYGPAKTKVVEAGKSKR